MAFYLYSGPPFKDIFRLKIGPFSAPLHTPAPPEAAARRMFIESSSVSVHYLRDPRGRGQPRSMEPATSAQGPLATSDGRQWGFTCQSALLGNAIFLPIKSQLDRERWGVSPRGHSRPCEVHWATVSCTFRSK